MLSNTRKSFLALAQRIAANSEQRHRHGAVIVKSGRVVGAGYNKRRNHPSVVMEGRHRIDSAVHAEAAALADAGNNTRGALLFVARVNNNGKPLLSKPCEQCEQLIEQSGIKEVIWS